MPEACAHGAVALGALAHSLNLPLAAARDAFAFAAVRDACSAAVRLGLCQPTRAVAVQREVLARPRPGVPAVEDAAAAAPAVDAAHCAPICWRCGFFGVDALFLLAAFFSHGTRAAVLLRRHSFRLRVRCASALL